MGAAAGTRGERYLPLQLDRLRRFAGGRPDPWEWGSVGVGDEPAQLGPSVLGHLASLVHHRSGLLGQLSLDLVEDRIDPVLHCFEALLHRLHAVAEDRTSTAEVGVDLLLELLALDLGLLEGDDAQADGDVEAVLERLLDVVEADLGHA